MFQVHQDIDSGEALSGHWDPSTEISFLPRPLPGMVRVPVWASIQTDGPEALVACHAILRRVDLGPGWLTHPDTCILWAVKLTPEAMVGGEYFVPGPLLPLPEGWEIIASWSYATGAHQMRTRAVSVEVPAATFDWSRVVMPSGPFPRLTTV